MMSKILWGAAVVAIFWASMAIGPSAAGIDAIRIAVPSWKDVTNPDGTGLYFDVLRKIYDPLGIAVEYTIVPWKRAMMMVDDHEADALPGGYFMPGNRMNALFPRYPIGSETLAVVALKKDMRPWKGQPNLAGKQVVWIRNYNFHKFLDVKVKWREIDHGYQGWKLVDSGRVDFYMDNLNILNRYIIANGIDMDRYAIHVVKRKSLYLRFSNTDRSRRLIDIYDSRLPVLIEAGDIRALFEKWGFPFPVFVPRIED